MSRCRLGEANFLDVPRAVETEKDAVPMSTSLAEAFEMHLRATALLNKHWKTQEEAFNTGKPSTLGSVLFSDQSSLIAGVRAEPFPNL